MEKHIRYTALIASLFLLAATACRQEDPAPVYGDEFRIEEPLTELYVPSEGLVVNEDNKALNRFTVRSDAAWSITPQKDTTYEWIRIFPAEGTADGYFYVIVKESKEPEIRTASFDIRVNGEARETFSVIQAGIEPFLKPSLNSRRFNRNGGTARIRIQTNIDYELTADREDYTQWVKILRQDKDSLCFTVLPSQLTEPREVNFSLRGKDYPLVGAEISVEQTPDDATLITQWSFPAPTTLTAEEREALYNTKEHWMRSDDLNSLFFWYKKVPDAGETSTYKADESGGYVRYLLTGVAKGDYYQMDIPVRDLTEGVIEYTLHHTSSAGGPKFWLAQWSLNGKDWNDINADLHFEEYDPEAEMAGHDIYYSYAISPVNNTANEMSHINFRFDIPAVRGEGTLHIRHTVADAMNNQRKKNFSAGHGGTTRVASEIVVNYIPKTE